MFLSKEGMETLVNREQKQLPCFNQKAEES